MLVQADKKQKRREYYLRRREYYLEQNKAWRDANKERRKENAARKYQQRKQANPALFMWKQAKHRAKFDYDGMDFSIKVEDIHIPERCPYLNTVFIPLDKHYGYSLDRIDSSRGYTSDNIQVISTLANIMKNNATKAQLIRFAEGVLRVHSEKE